MIGGELVLIGGSYRCGPLTAGYSFSYANYADLDVSETLHEPALGYAVSQNLSFLAKLVIWRRKTDVGTADVDRSLNVTLHGSF